MTQDVLPTQGIFTDQAGLDAGAMFAILIGAMIAAGGGLGGGGVFVPIYILILSYPPKFAVALSQATIFGGSIVNLIMNLKKFHPTRKHRPLTDFSTLLIFEPMLLVGTIIGVLFNVMFPDMLILVCLVLVLSYATLRISRKGIRLWKKETNEMKEHDVTNNDMNNDDKPYKVNVELQAVQSAKNGTDDKSKTEKQQRTDIIESDATLKHKHPQRSSKDGLMTDANGAHERVTDVTDIDNIPQPNTSSPEVSSEVDSAADNNNHINNYTGEIMSMADSCGIIPSQISEDKVELCKSFIETESQIIKPGSIILIVWFFVSLFSILKKETITGVDNCGGVYWFITFLPFPIMMGVSYFMTKREYDFYNDKINSGCWVPAFGDIKLDGDFIKILKYPLIASIAGILGGFLGIGGGMIVSPLLIELGVIPTVAAATSAMAVLITSSSAMLQFLLLGFLQWDYTLFFMFVGIVGTFIGQTAVNYAVKEYGRVSVVIFAVAIIMGLAIFLMLISGLIALVDGVSWEFSPPC